MTDEEMVAEYLKDDSKYLIEDAEGNLINITKKVREAFLAGRPKWHKVADGDLPKSLMSVVNQDGEKVIYNDYCKSWRYDDADEYICATPIVWCEIPTYTEE